MDKTRIGEWILSLVLPPDRAASVAGDFAEDAVERGNVWFWSCVFRTVFAHIRNDLAARPAGMACLGLVGFLRNQVIFLAIFLALSWTTHGDIRYTHEGLWSVLMTRGRSLPRHWTVRWQIELVLHLLQAAWLFQTGRWIARQVPGREGAACVAVALTGWIAILSMELLSRPGIIKFRPTPELFTMGVVHDIALIAGALWMRRRTVRVTTH